jgi:hypothetical protein
MTVGEVCGGGACGKGAGGTVAGGVRGGVTGGTTGGAGTTGGFGPAPTADPHFAQNFTPAASAPPQFTQKLMVPRTLSHRLDWHVTKQTVESQSGNYSRTHLNKTL